MDLAIRRSAICTASLFSATPRTCRNWCCRRLIKRNGKPIDAAYNKTRAANEPLYESPRSAARRKLIPIAGQPTNSPDSSSGTTGCRRTSSGPLVVKAALSAGRCSMASARRLQSAGNRSSMASSVTPTRRTRRPASRTNFTGKFAFENNAKARLSGGPGAPAGQVQQIQESEGRPSKHASSHLSTASVLVWK